MTLEEIRNGIAENPELENEIISDIKNKGFVVRTADENTAWEKQFEDSKIGPRVKEIYGGIETDILTAFGKHGVTKESNTEKVYDLVKKAAAKLDAKLADTEQKLADALAGKGDDVTKAQLKALQEQVDTLTAEKERLETEYLTKELNLKAGNNLKGAFSELQIVVPASVSDKDKAEYIKEKTAQIESLFAGRYTPTEQDGKIVWKDKDGVIQMTGANVATEKELLAKSFKYDFEVVNKGGSGSSRSQQQQFTRVQTKDELYAQVAKEGLPMGSASWSTRVNELAKANGIALPS